MVPVTKVLRLNKNFDVAEKKATLVSTPKKSFAVVGLNERSFIHRQDTNARDFNVAARRLRFSFTPFSNMS